MSPAKRRVLGAVRRGQQWRIRRPESVSAWACRVRQALGLPEPRERALRNYGIKKPVLFEAFRLWLAVRLGAVAHGPVNRETLDASLLLWQVACDVLEKLPPAERDFRTCKAAIETALVAGQLPFPVRKVMAWWPTAEVCAKVAEARTTRELEKLRRQLDYAEALQKLKATGVAPTASNVEPLLHLSFVEHINDTGETFHGAIRVPSRHEIERIDRRVEKLWQKWRSLKPKSPDLHDQQLKLLA
ncbi:MAG: Asp-tRNA(Asn)/Glu-tRNA(Gln) amidotransferase subunit GatC, partial [Verrucomicrobiia bacterium]